MKIGAYIEVAIVAFPYKFCRMINILLDEGEGTWRCLPLVLRSGNIGKENHVFLEGGKGREMQVNLPHNGYKVPQKVAVT